jgi:hypothetical protein
MLTFKKALYVLGIWILQYIGLEVSAVQNLFTEASTFAKWEEPKSFVPETTGAAHDESSNVGVIQFVSSELLHLIKELIGTIAVTVCRTSTAQNGDVALVAKL